MANLPEPNLVALQRLNTDEAFDGDYATSLKQTGREFLKICTNLEIKGEIDPDSLFETPFLISDFYAHQVRLKEDRDGHRRKAVRLVFINPEGKHTQFTGEGVFVGFCRILRHWGSELSKDPIPVMTVSQKTSSNYETILLKIVDTPIDTPKKSK